ncbi:MAG: hypothetical protein KatS3mg026_1816 [Bacteroidia bacterium]|nr:MAG: hypothetical protein KatS3mg026_1816 [Bacteroidia bacterium]
MASELEAILYLADSRCMREMPDESISLILTSPPYWHLKDYGVPNQIGYGQSLHEYLYDLGRVWRECWRVLQPGRRLCINVGDQFARATTYGTYQVIPLHAEIIAQCVRLGFVYLGAIIWQKKSTLRPSGGAVVMGSFPYPPNGLVELDYEFILLFRKPGKGASVPPQLKAASALTREEWKAFFRGHWQFAGERQRGHEAMFPEELPARLIRMFSFVGEVVLDPFAGSGTTLRVALRLGRRAVGYEIQRAFLPGIRQKVEGDLYFQGKLRVVEREGEGEPVEPPPGYLPMVADLRPRRPSSSPPSDASAPKVKAILWPEHQPAPILLLSDGRKIRFWGLLFSNAKRAEVQAYLQRYLQGKPVLLWLASTPDPDGSIPAYVYRTNRLFVNRKLIMSELAEAHPLEQHPYATRFLQIAEKYAGSRGWQ